MTRKKHTDPNCQCCACKSKRGEYSGKNNPMYGKGYLLIGKNKGKKRAKHKSDCQCSFCKAERRELVGNKNPMFGKERPAHKLDCQCYFCRAKRGETFGKNNHDWKGEEYQNAKGYWIKWVDSVKYLRARYVAEQCLGRKLLKEEIVHHMNKDKGDDRPENLYVFSSAGKHMKWHNSEISPMLTSNLI